MTTSQTTRHPRITGTGPVLIVDDSEADTFVAQRAYRRSSLRNPLLCLDSGEKLLAYLEKARGGLTSMPELVLLDINMPAPDGFETLAEVREISAFRELSVAMLTTSTSQLEREMSAALGATGFFTKPDDIGGYVEFFESLAA